MSHIDETHRGSSYESEDQPPPRLDRYPNGANQFPPGSDQSPPMLDRHPPGSDQSPPRLDSHPPGSDQSPPRLDRHPPGLDQFPPGLDQFHPRLHRIPPESGQFPPGSDQFPPGSDQFPSGSGQFPPESDHFPPRSERLTSVQNQNQQIRISPSHSIRSLAQSDRPSSVSSSNIVRKRAKAEAAKAKAEFAEMEANLRKQHAALEEREQLSAAYSTRQKSDLKVDLNLLEIQKEAAIAQAEANVLQSLSFCGDKISNETKSLLSVPVQNPVERTELYVHRHSQSYPIHTAPVGDLHVNKPYYPAKTLDQKMYPTPCHSDNGQTLNDNIVHIKNDSRSLQRPLVTPQYNPNAPTFVPRTFPSSYPQQSHDNNGQSADFARFLLKKELILTRLTNFTDKPECYAIWKSNFLGPIVRKLPYSIQEKWTSRAVEYKQRFKVPFPPFSYFAEFIRNISKIKNDPSFHHDQPTDIHKPKTTSYNRNVSVKKTDTKHQSTSETKITPDRKCPLHNSNHPLNECHGFSAKSLHERKQLLKQWGICYRCCTSADHMAHICDATVNCNECGSNKHPSALHIKDRYTKSTSHGGEFDDKSVDPKPSKLDSKCTQICGNGFGGKSCAKTILVKTYPEGHPEKAILAYAIHDDQSNASLATSDYFDLLDIQSDRFTYTLSSCSGLSQMSGRKSFSCVVESLDSQTKLNIPTLIECNNIPDNREEIPTPAIARAYSHLNNIERYIPPLNNNAKILLLIGRNLPEAHHVNDQRLGPRNTPFAQKLPLGWAIIGETCLNNVHTPNVVTVNKVNLLPDGRTSIFEPCPNKLKLNENIYQTGSSEPDIFERRQDDDKEGLSVEDREFLDIVERDLHKNEKGNWVAPLPFKSNRRRLPNNRTQAEKRAQTLDRSLKKSPEKKQHFLTFMQGVFDSGHAELAPPLTQNEECWYLPIFGVYHPQKPNQIRAVFDSSSQYSGVSLNDVLLSGPDMTNNLLGILLRFRKEAIAITADIQQMFHCFYVQEDHRNFLRFLWYRDNNFDNDLVEYRMSVHVFGNTSSPAIATYGLRRTAQAAEEVFGTDVIDFVNRNFYVDDGVTSLPTAEQAIDLMTRTQQALKTEGNLRLHKITSNDPKVMQSFPLDDLAKDLKDLDLGSDTLPAQRSLGLTWDLSSDVFTFRVSTVEKPYTRRGILSTVNGLYDPLGFVAPVVIHGKLLLRDLISETQDWDEPLPNERQKDWQDWRDSLKDLESLHINRTYVDTSLQEATSLHLHVFSDASEKAIAAVAYLKATTPEGSESLGFIMGKAKVAPRHGHSIPRLELCAAVLAVNVAQIVTEQLDIELSSIQFHTDSKVVLGYIQNSSRRFYKYVSNRVEKIRRFSQPSQWAYVTSKSNPADEATRCIPSSSMQTSMWLTGPPKLKLQASPESYPLVDPELDKEIRPVVTVMKTAATDLLGSGRFERFSVWQKLVKSVACLKHISRSYHTGNPCKGWHLGPESRTVDLYNETERQIIKEVQREVFAEEMCCLERGKPLSKDSSILKLNPILDKLGMCRVGGRINKSDISSSEKNPLIIQGRSHIALLLTRHYHDRVHHQGRHFTEGVIRAAGLWITGGKRLISKVIHNCVKCRILRGKLQHQKMADLPQDRLTPAPPFSYVGVDVFGPWQVVTRKTRGGQATSKRWAVIFTCLSSRAIHLEVIQEMSSSSFINSMRRFISIRGKVLQIRSDRGSNFIGATNELKINTINVEDSPVKDFLFNNGLVWMFNSPHSSHMGGVWERLIRTTRQILNSMMIGIPSKNLTHEVLTTFLAEVAAIVNSRPIVPVSSDPECAEILSPSCLLTQKVGSETQPLGQWDTKDLYRSQWKCVQALADTFWTRWRREYLQTLQYRRKWSEDRPNLNKGDIVLLKEPNQHRNDWPMGIIVNTFPGDDGKVRKVELKISKGGKCVVYTRPVTELVVLVPVA